MYLKEFGCKWAYGRDCCHDFEKKEWELQLMTNIKSFVTHLRTSFETYGDQNSFSMCEKSHVSFLTSNPKPPMQMKHHFMPGFV